MADLDKIISAKSAWALKNFVGERFPDLVVSWTSSSNAAEVALARLGLPAPQGVNQTDPAILRKIILSSAFEFAQPGRQESDLEQSIVSMCVRYVKATAAGQRSGTTGDSNAVYHNNSYPADAYPDKMPRATAYPDRMPRATAVVEPPQWGFAERPRYYSPVTGGGDYGDSLLHAELSTTLATLDRMLNDC